jgi:hypothetical protein
MIWGYFNIWPHLFGDVYTPDLVLRASCVFEKVGVNQEWYSRQKLRVVVLERSKPGEVKPKMTECKLRSGVNW